jgi:hypothetical protein
MYLVSRFRMVEEVQMGFYIFRYTRQLRKAALSRKIALSISKDFVLGVLVQRAFFLKISALSKRWPNQDTFLLKGEKFFVGR